MELVKISGSGTVEGKIYAGIVESGPAAFTATYSDEGVIKTQDFNIPGGPFTFRLVDETADIIMFSKIVQTAGEVVWHKK